MKKRTLKQNAYLNTLKLWSKPVRRLYYALRDIGFNRTTPNAIYTLSFVMERPFVCRHTGEEFIFDFAVYSTGKNVYIELDDPGHAQPWQRRRDKRKDRAAKRAGMDVVRIPYAAVDGMDKGQLMSLIERALLR